jgi:hypothetical protein
MSSTGKPKRAFPSRYGAAQSNYKMHRWIQVSSWEANHLMSIHWERPRTRWSQTSCRRLY